jgi:hypothetical protein
VASSAVETCRWGQLEKDFMRDEIVMKSGDRRDVDGGEDDEEGDDGRDAGDAVDNVLWG